MNQLIIVAVLGFLLTACAPKNNQNSYSAGEVGISRAVEFGTVLNVREVDITTKSSGTGTLLGAGVGAGAGSYVGSADGNLWATAGAAVAGAVAGTLAEQALNSRTGTEYVVRLQSGETKTIVQEKNEKDAVFKAGDTVMLQYCDQGEHAAKCKEGTQYQRLFPVKKLPPYVKKKRKLVKG